MFITIEANGKCIISGLALLEFRERVSSDPFGTFANWNPEDKDPCMWSGVHCVDGKVQML